MEYVLPAGFFNARDLTFVSQFTECDAADAEFTHITVRTAGYFATVVQTNRRCVGRQLRKCFIVAFCFVVTGSIGTDELVPYAQLSGRVQRGA